MNVSLPRLFLTALLAVSAAPAASALAVPPPSAQDGGAPPAVHTHTWVKQTRKEWVPPEKKVVQVGVDAKGKPIYETKIVKPGYYKTVVFYRCSCGATRG